MDGITIGVSVLCVCGLVCCLGLFFLVLWCLVWYPNDFVIVCRCAFV